MAVTAERPDTIEAKARLLLAREREVYELRLTRARAEDWLRAVHALAPDHLEEVAERLMARATDLLVGSLSFERAGAFEYAADGAICLAVSDPAELPSDLRLDASVLEGLALTPDGSCEPGTDHFLAPFAMRLGLTKYRWSSCESARETQLLFMAGFGERTAQFHRLTKIDQDHFAIFANHAAALVNNGLLLSSVRSERRELEEANAGLASSLEQLENTRAKLVESTRMVATASRQAGMAEVATGILHNVGNVLNSVNVCGEVALSQVEGMPISGLQRSLQLLDEQPDLAAFFSDDPRAPKLIEYLHQCTQCASERQTELRSELTQLMGHLAHVGAIVCRQQAYAKRNATEVCDLALLTEDALLLASPSRQERGIEVVREFERVPELWTDKHRVLQIIVNLIANALQALADSGRADKRLTARLLRAGDAAVELQVVDNGVGIDPKHAPLLFQHGFTTRRDGHGFGLHTSALTARELGGELTWSSQGPGMGACFVLRLPLSTPVPPEETAS